MDMAPGSDPFETFDQWMKTAASTPGVKEPTAMAIATADSNGEIHNRVVLCKSWSKEGLTFYTNYTSQKGRELAERPQVGAVFFWECLAQQIRLSGQVTKVSRETTLSYWRTRPRESQISQYLSKQSEPVVSREYLQSLWEKTEKEFSGREIPCPENWGGYLLAPRLIEFWQGQPGRLHDRIQFEKSPSGWTLRRLYP